MYLGVPTQKSCARAWVAAASAVIARGDESYNVVIDVEDPWNHDDNDNEVITLVDKFLKAHDENPIITVANTIFPQSLYEAEGSHDFYDVYHRDFDKLSDTKLLGSVLRADDTPPEGGRADVQPAPRPYRQDEAPGGSGGQVLLGL